MELEPVIGLEVHCQLATRSKLFCRCVADFGGTPNSRICPVCTAQPGALPVLNEQALALALNAGLALHCTIRDQIKFDRKNYYYPDLPKGYQISQFDEPLCEWGELEFELEKGGTKVAKIRRIHMEEDAGKALHPDGANVSLVDLNRAGVPLVEIVGMPDLCSPAEASAYLQTLRRTLRFAGVSECDMEKGSLRCDANISVRPKGQEKLGTKVEVKNINSFKNVERALMFEIARQSEMVARGEPIVQETRSFRDTEGSTIAMRKKEDAHDYRYFPDPDLPLFDVGRNRIEQARAALPEGFVAKRRRYQASWGLTDYDTRVLTEEPATALFFESVVAAGLSPKSAANWIQGEVLAFLGETKGSTKSDISELKITATELHALVQMEERGELSHQAAKKVLRRMLETGVDAQNSAVALDLLQIRDSGALAATIDEVISTETKVVADYRGGKETALNALLGRAMRATKGKGDPNLIRELLLQKLGKPGS
ncbi:MAG: Asp-tRNA(Asn)/Glu-tRNA(Gln) amidotransferase subunit GatB [Planctomycetes bacterium]|nr:Asp-tRNA(Asn)/Glu-tRNA(Gln) amidotransferase subunit GatB [Planctomycetota bacterium]